MKKFRSPLPPTASFFLFLIIVVLLVVQLFRFVRETEAAAGTLDISSNKFTVSGAVTGKALTIFNETGDQNILTASRSGTTVMNLGRNGDVSLTNSGSSDVNINLSSTGDFTVQDNGSTFLTLSDTGAYTLTLDATDNPAFTITNSGSGNVVTNLAGTGDYTVQDNGTNTFVVSDTGTVAIGNGGTAFTAITKNTTSWDPPSTANGGAARADVALSGDRVIACDPPTVPSCGGFGCVFNCGGEYMGFQKSATGATDHMVLFFTNASGGTINPAAGTWTYWTLTE